MFEYDIIFELAKRLNEFGVEVVVRVQDGE